MGMWSLLGEDEVTAAVFKKTDGGWIYRTPAGRRLFGLARSYRVSDAQKAELAALQTRLWRVSMLGVAPLIIVLLILSKAYPVLTSGYDLLAAAAAGGAIGLSVLLYQGLTLRKRLAHAQPSSETISLCEQQRNFANAMPFWRAVLFTAFSTLMVALAVTSIEKSGLSTSHRVACVLMFGASALYFGFVLFAKLRQRTRAS